jgi:hypothetical protein
MKVKLLTEPPTRPPVSLGRASRLGSLSGLPFRPRELPPCSQGRAISEVGRRRFDGVVWVEHLLDARLIVAHTL